MTTFEATSEVYCKLYGYLNKWYSWWIWNCSFEAKH